MALITSVFPPERGGPLPLTVLDRMPVFGDRPGDPQKVLLSSASLFHDGHSVGRNFLVVDADNQVKSVVEQRAGLGAPPLVW